MAILTTDILYKFSVKTGTAGNSTVGTAAGSLGKYISTTAWAGGTLHDLFDVVTGDENAASVVDYRGIFIHNAHASLVLTAPFLWITAETAGGATLTLATDNIAASAIGASAAQEAEIATEITAPTGVSAFSGPTTKATGLALSDIAAGSCKGIWLKRAAANTVALDSDGATIRVEGDTAA